MSYRIENNPRTKLPEIVIEGWERGIASSPHTGLQDIRGMNVEDTPGIAKIKPEATKTSPAKFAYTFTAVAATDVITYASAIAQTVYVAVTFTTTGTLPAGLSLATTYFLITTGATTAKVATTLANAIAGTAIDITDAGTGVHTINSVNMGEMKQAVIDPRTQIIYTVDSNGKVWGRGYATGGDNWQLIVGNTLTNASGNGIAVFANWLFVFRNNVIDVFGDLRNTLASRTWSNSWKTLEATTAYSRRRDTLVGQDNTLYWTDFDDDFSVSQENLGFIGSLRPRPGQALFGDTGNPATSSSTTNYSFNTQALDFPSMEEPIALEELNEKLVIGVNPYSTTAFQRGYSKLYTWDRIAETFDFPLLIPDIRIVDLVNLNNLIYIFVGNRGRCYVTNGSSLELAFKIPDSLFTDATLSAFLIEGNPLTLFPTNSTTFSYNCTVARGRLFFGVNFNGASALYSYEPKADRLIIENRFSGGSYGDIINGLVNITCVVGILTAQNSMSVNFAWFDGATSTYGWDLEGTTGNPTASGYALVISDIIPVGTKIFSRTFGDLEWRTDTPISAQDTITLYVRKGINQAWTQVGTTTGNASNNIYSDVYTINIQDAQWVQVKAICSSVGSGGTMVRLNQLRIR
jgi:hypothetical protein